MEAKGLLKHPFIDQAGNEVRKEKEGDRHRAEEDREAVDGPRRVDNDVFLASTPGKKSLYDYDSD